MTTYGYIKNEPLNQHKYQKDLNVHIYFYSINNSQDIKLTSLCLRVPTAMIEHHDQSNLEMKGFISA